MPKVYEDCVRNNITKGLSKKTAQRKCAIWYYKKFGKTPSHSELASMDENEKAIFTLINILIDNK